MRRHSPENERIKRAYFIYLKEARRLSEPSIDAAAAALNLFEAYTKSRDFKAFHVQQAVGFKRKLADQVSGRTGKSLSKRTILSTLNALRAFFQWLASQPGYRSRISFTDADYFSLSEKETRIARTATPKHTPSLEQIRHVLQAMPAETDIQLRDRAVIAFTLLTGARDGATASLKLKHIDIKEGKVEHDAREVHTKFSKTFTTWFFPVGDDVHQILVNWVSFLTQSKLFGPDDPLFPATHVALGREGLFQAGGLSRQHWSNANPIRAIFKQAFENAGLHYFNPHAIRRTLVRLGEQVCQTPEEFKAWSQNLGHESVLTTFASYGEVSATRQAELMRQAGRAHGPRRSDSILEQIAQILRSERSTGDTPQAPSGSTSQIGQEDDQSG